MPIIPISFACYKLRKVLGGWAACYMDRKVFGEVGCFCSGPMAAEADWV